MKNEFNPFNKVSDAPSKVVNQKTERGIVVKKKAGRPKKPSSKRLGLCVDVTLVARLRKYDLEHGYKGISSVATDAFLSFLQEKGY